MNVPTVKPKMRTDVVGTMKSLPLGIPHKFRTREMKYNSVIANKQQLEAKGYKFEVSIAGLVNEVLITRIK